MLTLTKYEKTVIVGLRATHLSKGAVSTINTDSNNIIDIAKKELEEKSLPYIINRKFPDKKVISYKITDFKNIDELVPKTFQ